MLQTYFNFALALGLILQIYNFYFTCITLKEINDIIFIYIFTAIIK